MYNVPLKPYLERCAQIADEVRRFTNATIIYPPLLSSVGVPVVIERVGETTTPDLI